MNSSTVETFTTADHRYRVVRPLGEGGQGKTFLVEREGEEGSRYVLKLLRMEHVDDWKQVEAFEREVETLATLDHPGIPRLVDRLVEDDRTAGIVQTFVEGKTVAQVIADGGAMSAPRFGQVVRESIELLVYLQQQVPPVLHRDINPRNLMLGPDRVHLIDFGAVRVGGKTDMTSVGTFGYMPPEQIIGRAVPASDVYGLGMTLVTLAERREVGDLPHDDATGRVDTSKLLRKVPARVRGVVLGMIEPGLSERLTDLEEALARLQGRSSPPAIGDDDTPTPMEMMKLPAVERLEPSPTPASLPIKLALAGGLLVAAVAFVFVFSIKPEEPKIVEHTVVAPEVQVPMPVPPGAFEIPSPPEPMPQAEPPPSPPRPSVPIDDEPLTDDNAARFDLRTDPPGAIAFIDGVKVCQTPCSTLVEFGRHEVRVRLRDQEVDRSVNLLSDTELVISLEGE